MMDVLLRDILLVTQVSLVYRGCCIDHEKKKGNSSCVEIRV